MCGLLHVTWGLRKVGPTPETPSTQTQSGAHSALSSLLPPRSTLTAGPSSANTQGDSRKGLTQAAAVTRGPSYVSDKHALLLHLLGF